MARQRSVKLPVNWGLGARGLGFIQDPMKTNRNCLGFVLLRVQVLNIHMLPQTYTNTVMTQNPSSQLLGTWTLKLLYTTLFLP